MRETGWRTLLIRSGATLRHEDGRLKVIKSDEEQLFPLDQLRLLILDSPSITLNTSLLEILTEKNIRVVVCDKRHQPSSEFNSYSEHSYTAGNMIRQSAWKKSIKKTLWKNIIANKISNQISILVHHRISGADNMRDISAALTEANTNNSEARAARCYFSDLFGNDFNRRTVCDINSALNYGYSIIMSQVSRSIVSYGYHPALGIEHHSESNSYNLSCDIMEPFRPIVDDFVYIHSGEEFTLDMRKQLIELMYSEVFFNGKGTELQTAIDAYTLNCIRFMNGEYDKADEVRIYDA